MLFDLFDTYPNQSQSNYRVVSFCGRYAIVTPFGRIIHQGKRKHIAYTWNRRYAQTLKNTFGSYWKNNPYKFVKVAYAYA